MIAYNKTLLDNHYLEEQACQLKQSGFITTEQYKNIDPQILTLKSQKNLFFRIGFFVLGCMLYASISGFLSLMLLATNGDHYLFFIYFFAIMGFGVKEFMSSGMNFFGFGLDDAFILGGIATLLTAIGLSFEQNYQANYLAIFVVMAIVSSFTYLRYLNLPLALLACIGITGSTAFLLLDYCIIGKAILPFAMLLLAGLGYSISKKKSQNLILPYYHNGLMVIKGFCLVIMYFAVNYYVVREVNAALSEEYYYNGLSPEIPFALLFWGFTFIIPSLYLFFSIKNKDRMLLWIGFITLCFSFFTFRTYHHVLPPEVALTIGGLVLFAFTYFSIKKTKHKETGITFKVDKFSNPNAFANLQVLVAASQFGLKPEATVAESPMEFGDGGFSGGGSSGDF